MAQKAQTIESPGAGVFRPRSQGRVLSYRSRVIAAVLVSGWLRGTPAASQQRTPACDVQRIFKQAGRLLSEKKYTEAEAELGSPSLCFPLSPQNTFALGVLYGRAHNFRKALALFNSIDSNVPDMATHLYAVALSQFELQDYQGTVSTLQSMAAAHALGPDAANLLAVSDSKVGQYQEAYSVLTDELKAEPADLAAHMNLVTLLVDAGKLTEAAQAAGDTLKSFPDNTEVWVMRGATRMLLGETAEAKSDFASALRLSPQSAPSLFLLALADFKQGDYASAASSINTGIAAGINSADLHYLLAECELKLEPTKSGEAMHALDEAIGLDSEAIAARTLRGKLLLDNGRPKDALPDLVLAHKANPKSRSATYNLARTYSALGRTEDARSLYQQLGGQSTDIVNETGNQKVMQALGGTR